MPTVHRTCTLCEATCGLSIEIGDDGRTLGTIRGDAADPFSQGYLCPKAHGLGAFHDDPDRLRAPLIRKGGELVPASWDEAFAAAIAGLDGVRRRHGQDAIAVYLGNPSAHSVDLLLYLPALIRALGTRQRYSASTLDQMPAQVVAAALYGGALTIPVPDVDRTDRLLILGGNPVVSNGSLMTAPDMKGRLDAIRRRGGKVVVIDPRRTETAARADEHVFIRPGTDAYFLLAMIHVLVGEGLVAPGAAAPHLDHLDEVSAIAARFAPERVAARTGIAADTIRRLAREQAAAPTAACYGRVGTTCQEFGTLASWAVQLVNILTGNLDRPGGTMFTTPAVAPGHRRRPTEKRGPRYTSRVRQLPEVFGELPIATLADEILEPGEGRVRALLTVAGNPLLSAPGAGRLATALAELDFRVAIDPYVNETTRLADVILPPPSPLERPAYDVALYQLAVRDVARWSPPALPRPAGHPAEWEIALTLAKGLMGMSAAPLAMADDVVTREAVARELADLPAPAPTADDVMALLGPNGGPERLIDFYLRVGPHGDQLGGRADGLTLDRLRAHPHGLDLGALRPRLPEVVRTVGHRIDLTPPTIVADLARLEDALDRAAPELVLINRRSLRSNNSWMHNLTPLIKGPERCTLRVHPDDAARFGLVAGGRARVTSRVGEVVAPVEITDELMPGVVSLPHGFGHDLPGVRLAVARQHAGVNVNLLSDDALLDRPSGNAALNGVAVAIAPER
ncbi:MAG TPA: molybdopterin-dependent oxidoreductase [Kofleriaceae bacterium]|nr:molybdopterin-dependent oxidoreductase [Kofleriaceae bacterium]